MRVVSVRKTISFHQLCHNICVAIARGFMQCSTAFLQSKIRFELKSINVMCSLYSIPHVPENIAKV